MAIITNILPQKGETATASNLNQLFTDVQTATNTAMNSQNVAGQGLDTQNFALAPVTSGGQAGIILMDYASATVGSVSPVTVPLQAGLTPTWTTVPGVLSYGATGQAMLGSSMIRVYFNLNVSNKNYQTPFAATGGTYKQNFYCWCVWLEYASTWNGGTGLPDTWLPVPGQSDWSTLDVFRTVTYRLNTTNQIKATAIIPHAQYFDNAGTLNRAGQYVDNFAGQYYYVFPTTQTWYGLRLKIGGLFQSVGDGTTNYLGWEQSNGFDTFNSVVHNTGDITAIVQRTN